MNKGRIALLFSLGGFILLQSELVAKGGAFSNYSPAASFVANINRCGANCACIDGVVKQAYPQINIGPDTGVCGDW